MIPPTPQIGLEDDPEHPLVGVNHAQGADTPLGEQARQLPGGLPAQAVATSTVRTSLFDAGAHADGAPSILATLRRPCTQPPFPDRRLGRLVPRQARQIASRYPVGNHTWNHPNLPTLSAAAVRDQLVHVGSHPTDHSALDADALATVISELTHAATASSPSTRPSDKRQGTVGHSRCAALRLPGRGWLQAPLAPAASAWGVGHCAPSRCYGRQPLARTSRLVPSVVRNPWVQPSRRRISRTIPCWLAMRTRLLAATGLRKPMW
jgi:hypothetical protein